MKFAWSWDVPNLAAWNSGLVEEINLDLYQDMLEVDKLEDDLNENDHWVIDN